MEEYNKTLSIIIPAYNAAKYIGSLLDEITTQVLRDVTLSGKVEIIVVNDGSSDDTASIVEEYEKDFPDLKLINQDNQGVSAARNRGFKDVKGEYVYFLDADDRIDKGAIKFYLETIALRNAYLNREVAENLKMDIFSFGYVSEEGNKNTDYFWDEYDGMHFDNEAVNKLYLSKRICFHIGSTIFDKAFLEKNHLAFTEGLKIGEDIEFILKALACSEHFSYHSRVCFMYQIHEDSAMQGYKSYSMTQFNSFLVNVGTVEELTRQESPDGKELDLNKKESDDNAPNGAEAWNAGKSQPCGDLRLYYNFFLANSYLSNLRYYYNSSSWEQEIDKGFIEYKYVLKRKLSSGDFKRSLAIRVGRILWIRLILKLHKNHVMKSFDKNDSISK